MATHSHMTGFDSRASTSLDGGIHYTHRRTQVFLVKARRNYHVFITSSPFLQTLLTLRHNPKTPHPVENKLAEACASRTHRRHQGCRPPVLKTGRVTGPHALPFSRPSMTSEGRGTGSQVVPRSPYGSATVEIPGR